MRKRTEHTEQRCVVHLLGEAELYICEAELPAHGRRGGLDRRDDLPDVDNAATQVEDIGALEGYARGADERPRYIVGELHVKAPAKGDVEGLSQSCGKHCGGGTGGQALIAPRAINDIRPQPDAGDSVIFPVDAGRALIGLLVDAIVCLWTEWRVMPQWPLGIVLADAIDGSATRKHDPLQPAAFG